MNLFSETAATPEQMPLAERMRPKHLNELLGQTHLVGDGRILRQMVEQDRLFSMIFWGPPGVGKTTLARIIARETSSDFHAMSAVTAGVKDVRKVIEEARYQRGASGRRSILFIDEIHRFNKAQQDALLHSVEDGTITLIGATTENPSFEVIAPLLSRCRVLSLQPLSDQELARVIFRALETDEFLNKQHVTLDEDAVTFLSRLAGGDARYALSILEISAELTAQTDGKKILSEATLKEALQKQALKYDKGGDAHYDTISAYIKSVRGSDPDAAVYYLARMLESGEDPMFIARRLVILASEDIGNAAPQGLTLANAAFQAVHAVGMPEARIILAQATTWLASAPKSNASYMAISQAMEDARNFPAEPIPLHIRNAPTNLMKSMNYGKGYKYAHDSDDSFVEQNYLPEKLKGRIYYRPKEIGMEKAIKERLEGWWKKRR